MIIPYRKYKNREGDLLHLPIVSVRVRCNGVKLAIWALIDSGADVTLLNKSFAQLFNVNFKKAKKIDLVGVMEGPGFNGYIQQINLEVKGAGRIDTIAAFTDSEKYPDYMILGRRGFFEHFSVKFEEYNKEVVIEPKDPNPPSFANAPVPPFLQ